MYTEAKKLHLIEEVLKIKSESVLKEIEAVVNRAKTASKTLKMSARDFSGLISEKDILLMEAAIKDGCEQVDPDDWK